MNAGTDSADLGPRQRSEDVPSAEDRRLLQLLALGETDEVVARHMGCTRRTLQRRLQRLFEKLGARSRFQAGILAERVGWITDIEDETPGPLPIRDTR